MTVRQDILARILTVLGGVASIKYVEVDKMTPVDLDTVPFPAAFVYSDSETLAEHQTLEFETWLWTVIIEVWGKSDSSMEDLLKDVHNAIGADPYLNGTALDSQRQGVEFHVIDPDESLRGMTIRFQIMYRHSERQM